MNFLFFSMLALIHYFLPFNAAKNYGWTQWSGFTPCDKDCMKERQRYCYNAGNPKACGGNVNVYGIETERVKCGNYECPGKHLSQISNRRDYSKAVN